MLERTLRKRLREAFDVYCISYRIDIDKTERKRFVEYAVRRITIIMHTDSLSREKAYIRYQSELIHDIRNVFRGSI